MIQILIIIIYISITLKTLIDQEHSVNEVAFRQLAPAWNYFSVAFWVEFNSVKTFSYSFINLQFIDMNFLYPQSFRSCNCLKRKFWLQMSIWNEETEGKFFSSIWIDLRDVLIKSVFLTLDPIHTEAQSGIFKNDWKLFSS